MAKGTNQVQATGSKGRQDLLKFDPEDLFLVTDEKHPLYDPRVNKPIDENLVKNIRMYGVIEPVIVRRNGETKDGKAIMEVIAGRQRVRCAREANKLLKEAGETPVLVPAIVKRGDDQRLFGVLVSENEMRSGDSTMEKAKKLQRYLDMGGDENEAATTFGVTRTTIRNYLALLDCDKAVQKAVDDGLITPSLAISEFSKMSREEQKEALAKVLASGATKGAKAKENVRAARNGGEPAEQVPRMPSRKKVEAAIEVVKYQRSDFESGFRACLDWMAGNKPRGWGEVKAALVEAGVIGEE